MKYAIVTIEWLTQRGIAITENMRKSVDGSKVILHYPFIEPILEDGEEITTYEYDSKELNGILSSDEWITKEETNGTETEESV